MKALLHCLLALLATVIVALPSPGSEGGENAGGTGVWILPFCSQINSGQEQGPASTARLTIPVTDFNRDVRLEISSQMGQAVATCVDEMTGYPTGLVVSGRTVIVPSQLMRSLSLARVNATILVMDASSCGYCIAVQVDHATGAINLLVY